MMRPDASLRNKRKTAAILDAGPANEDRAHFVRKLRQMLSREQFQVAVVRNGQNADQLQSAGWVFALFDGAEGISNEVRAFAERLFVHIIILVSPARSDEEYANLRMLGTKDPSPDVLYTRDRDGWNEGTLSILADVIRRTIKEHAELQRRVEDMLQGQLPKAMLEGPQMMISQNIAAA